MTDIKLVQDLKDLLDKNIDPVLFPVEKGDRINIGSYSIAKIANGYSVKSYRSNKIIAITYTKAAAIAIAKNLSRKKDIKDKVLELDKVIAKNHTDCIFYKHTMKTTKDFNKYESTLYRYDVSKQITDIAREKLNKFIL